jgi:TetR/AcrR family transcriptional regulator
MQIFNLWRDVMNKTKNLIFDSAIKIFSDKGYNGATMDEIAMNAGVAKGTLYYHFRSKEEIFKYIIDEGMRMIRDEIQTAVKNETEPLEKLREIFKVQLNLVHRNRDFFKVIASQLWGKEIRQLNLRNIMEKYISDIEVYIKEAMDAGKIKKGNTRLIAYSLLGNFLSSSIYQISTGEEQIEYTVQCVMEYILGGLRQRQI